MIKKTIKNNLFLNFYKKNKLIYKFNKNFYKKNKLIYKFNKNFFFLNKFNFYLYFLKINDKMPNLIFKQNIYIKKKHFSNK